MLTILLDALLSKISCTMLIKTRVGIKPVNQIVTSDYHDDIVLDLLPKLKFDQILNFPDFLKDKHTLLNKVIVEWPHYELIKYLDEGKPLSECEYIRRIEGGILDFRKKYKISHRWIKNIYLQKLAMIENGDFFTIKVCNVYDNIYVVADGKHSLAMAHYFKYPNFRFEAIENILFDTYYRWIFKKIERDKDFKIHQTFFERAHEFRKNKINRVTKKILDN